MPVYLDNNATTRLDPRVLEAMQPYLEGIYGNASSLHRYGRLVRSALERAREQLAAAVNAHPDQIVFTSGGTESNNLAIQGFAGHQSQPAAMAISAIEHPSLREPAFSLRRRGWRIEEIPVDADGVVDPSALAPFLSNDLRLVSVMSANNETGAVQPVAALGDRLRESGAVFHTDASQALGKQPVDFAASGAQMMTVSSHKLHGPPGAGALIVDKTVLLQPRQLGGSHEGGLRAGTENLPAIVGFAAAAALAAEELEQRREHMLKLRRRLESALESIPEVCIFAASGERLPNTVQFGVRDCHGETLLLKLDRAGMAVSSGSACHSGISEPSHVLTAMGVEQSLALTAIRVSLSPFTTEAEVDRFAAALNQVVGDFRNASVRAANA